MNIETDIQTVKAFFAAIRRGDKEALRALVAEDIEWIIPGKDWPLAGTHRGHAGLADLLETASRSIETSTEPREFVAQGDRVLVVGFARGKIKKTNKTFEDDWIFAITVRDGKLTHIREYLDTQALAEAAKRDASSTPSSIDDGAAQRAWLQGSAYRIALSPWYFVIGGLAAAAVAALTVAGCAIRLATAQPATALRYE